MSYENKKLARSKPHPRWVGHPFSVPKSSNDNTPSLALKVVRIAFLLLLFGGLTFLILLDKV